MYPINYEFTGDIMNFKFNSTFQKDDFIIGVDGGGTKTESIAYSLLGNEISKGISGFGNVLINFDEALRNIEESICKCISNLQYDRCKYICIGLAGCDDEKYKSLIKNHLEQLYKCPINIINDGDLALLALLKGQDGILTISGTGSITIGRNKTNKLRVGGWGHIIGDEGSGYDIVMKSIKKLFSDIDLGKPQTPLSEKILLETNSSTQRHLLNYIYTSHKDKISALLPIIVEFAENNDIFCKELLKDAGIVLAKNTILAYEKLGIKGTVNIGIKGSVLTKIDLVKDSFIEVLISKGIDYCLIDEETSSCKGAYYDYLHNV